jgi:tetratricopeptide (TPR) repeat protein
MRTKLLFFLIASSQIVYGQAKLVGYVTLQNSGKKSAYPAVVKSWGATDTDVRTEDGYYELIYDLKRPGSDAELEIVRDEYEVVNKEALFVRLPENPEKQTAHKIYLCPKGQWQQNARHYYNINDEVIERNYQRKIKELEKKYKLESQEYQDAIVALKKESQILKEKATEWAEKFAKKNLDEVSERYKKAFNYFVQGMSDSVYSILKEEELLADLKQFRKEQENAQELRKASEGIEANAIAGQKDISQQFYLLASEYSRNWNDNDAIRCQKYAIDADSTNIEALIDFSIILWINNQHNSAKIYFHQALRHATAMKDSALIMNGLGVISFDEKDLNDTIYFKKAFLIYKKLLQQDSSTYLQKIVSIQSDLGNSYMFYGDLDRAEKYFKESLDILDILQRNDDTDNVKVKDYIALILQNLGVLSFKKEKPEEAEKYYFESLKIYRDLATKDTIRYLPIVASILQNIGNLYCQFKNCKEAESYFLEALSIESVFAKRNPAVYLTRKAMTLYNLGGFYKIQGQFEQSIKSYKEALEIYRDFAKSNSKAYNFEVAKTAINICLLYGAHCEKELEIIYKDTALIYLKEAEEKFLTYPENTPELQAYLTNIKNLKIVLENLDNEISYKKSYNQLIDYYTLIDKEENIDKIIEFQDKIINELEVIKKLESDPNVIKGWDIVLNAAHSSIALLKGQFKEAENYAINGIKIDKSGEALNAILAPALLYQGEFNKARAIYTQYKGKPFDNQRSWTEVFLKDLNLLEKAGITHPDVAKVRKLLQE